MTEQSIELIQKGIRSLRKEDHATAANCYQQLVSLHPNEPIGYIGQALQMLIRPNGCSSQELAEAVRKCQGMQCSAEFQHDFVQLVNLQVGGPNAPLLTYACNNYNYEMAKLLVDFGAEVNVVSTHNVTPLWFVCRRELPKQQAADGRKIARLLLDQGATVDVVNDGGVALFNERTDPKIAELIRLYFPQTTTGNAPVKQANANGVSMTMVLAITGCMIGIALGTIFDKFLMGFVWAGLLAAVCGFAGAQVDLIRSGNEGAVGKGIRNILLVIAALVVFGSLLANCVKDPREYGHCSNCHSRMETKYIFDGGCEACNGRPQN